jgi:DNA-binding SARP family transcriptional activator
VPPLLRIQLLGRFQLIYAGERLPGVESPRLQSLIAYLLLHRDVPQPRQRVAFLLYPDSPEAQARANLRSLLHALRQALARPGLEGFLRAEGQTLQWQPEAPYQLDVDNLERASAAGDRTTLEQAVKDYQGELLPGCYDDWIGPARERLQAAYVDALERLLGLLAGGPDDQAGIAYAQQLLRQDPLREQSYAHLFYWYARSGDRSAVRRAYQACVEALQQELGAEPSAATRAAYQAALRQALLQPAPRPPAPRRSHNLPL